MRKKRALRWAFWAGVIALVVVVALFFWASSSPQSGPTAVADKRLAAPVDTVRGTAVGATVPAGDPLQPMLPDRGRTPGATFDVTAQDICVPGYSHRVRKVPSHVKRAVYRSYGIANSRAHRYEVDHLISLELGGSNAVSNLWPESYETTPWNAAVKDVLENELHRRICAGTLDLATAQRAIATDWIAAYRQYVQAHGSRRRRR